MPRYTNGSESLRMKILPEFFSLSENHYNLVFKTDFGYKLSTVIFPFFNPEPRFKGLVANSYRMLQSLVLNSLGKNILLLLFQRQIPSSDCNQQFSTYILRVLLFKTFLDLSISYSHDNSLMHWGRCFLHYIKEYILFVMEGLIQATSPLYCSEM